MTIVLMRHPARDKAYPEKDSPLTEEGTKWVKETAVAIASRIKTFDLILYGDTTAAKETAKQLLGADPTKVLSCAVLYRGESEVSWPSIKTEIEESLTKFGHSLSDKSSVALVGHEPGLSTLLRLLTGKASRMIGRGEAVLLTGLPDDMDNGHAILAEAFGSTYSSELVRKKVELKMTVSTFLGGFTIPVLIELVKEPATPFSIWRGAATVLFTLALGLFVAAVYMYDILLMPADRWGPTTKRSTPKLSSNSDFAHDYRLNGVLYAYMIQTWKLIFTPAVICTVIAFLLLLVDHCVHGPLGPKRPWWFLILCFLALCAARTAHSRFRPRLGIED